MKFEPQPSETAITAVRAIIESIDFDKKKGLGLREKEDRVRRFILESFPELGRAPTVGEVSEATGFSVDETINILDMLNDSDIIYLKPGTHKIEGAYPFSNSETPHRVTIKGKGPASAMCAIDALGVPFMFDADTFIESSCAQCNEDIYIEIKNGAIVAGNEPSVVVWVGTERCGPAATSICKTLLFICSREHIAEWRKENPGGGMALSLSEALYVGREIFKDFLRS